VPALNGFERSDHPSQHARDLRNQRLQFLQLLPRAPRHRRNHQKVTAPCRAGRFAMKAD